MSIFLPWYFEAVFLLLNSPFIHLYFGDNMRQGRDCNFRPVRQKLTYFPGTIYWMMQRPSLTPNATLLVRGIFAQEPCF